jgi:hypothetical protein
MRNATLKGWIARAGMVREYEADLGDTRRNARAACVGVAISESPGLSFPEIFRDEAELEGHYRLVRNRAVDWRGVHAPHVERTTERAAKAGSVAIVHDTTDVAMRTYWTGDLRQNMAKFTSRTQGFLLHASLAVTADGDCVPLGLLHMQPFVHQVGIGADDETRAYWQQNGGLYDNEHERWFSSVAETAKRLAAHGISPVHVMDCEADSYGLLSWLVQQGHRFVVRCDGTRKLEALGPTQDFGTRVVQLGERFDLRGSKKTNPSRRARTATLTIRATRVLARGASREKDASWSPGGYAAQPKTLELNLVEVIELNPPEGETAVRWLLLTTEPIETLEQVHQVVEIYRRRWTIEEYFKAIKTGCRLEDRQMDSAASMLRVLALLVPAAWRLLVMRTIAAQQPVQDWRRVLAPLEFRILQRAVPKARLDERATAAQCYLAIAKLGGHLPRNGAPGWQTLHAGWRRLEDYVAGARLAAM